MYGQQRCWVNKKGCALSLARLLVVVVGPEFQKKNEPGAISGQGQPLPGSVAERCPCTPAQRKSVLL